MNIRPTYTHEQIEEARALWDSFPSEWDQWREMAMKGPGMIFPPAGSIHDSWDEDPSQRALIVRAMRETPQLLTWAIKGAPEPSWSKVIERLLAGRDEMRDQADIADLRTATEKAQRTTPSQDAYSVGQIMTILGDSSQGTERETSAQGTRVVPSSRVPRGQLVTDPPDPETILKDSS